MLRCLVVEDMAATRLIYRRMLDRLGLQAVEAEDALLALELCREAMPDLVLADWNLPKMDGLAFVVALRQLPGGDKPKVLMCTIENSMEHIERALAAGIDEYVMKAFTIDILRDKLRQVGIEVGGMEGS